MAAALAAYESWRAKLDSASSVEEVDAIYADARKALADLTAGFTEGDTAPGHGRGGSRSPAKDTR